MTNSFDTLVRNGTVIDGTGTVRRVCDIGIQNGRIAAIGELSSASARQVIDAKGLIVAPGHIDLHTHYDAQIHWDPYCSNSGENGCTTVVSGNCGFGFAPCRPEDRDRYMLMMENTEQVPYAQMKQTLPWTWESFPEWMKHLRSLPKGVNHMMFMPINPLMIYVMGLEAAKSRRATADEMARMKALVHEAMDCGAAGIALSYLQEQNSHVDHDHTPMPSDTMCQDDAFELASVLGERQQGFIQVLSLLGPLQHYDFVEALARRSGRPVIENIFAPVAGIAEMLDPHVAWLETAAAKGLDIWGQAFLQQAWSEFNMLEININDHVAEWRELSSQTSVEAKIAKMRDADFRSRMVAHYDPAPLGVGSGPVEMCTLAAVPQGHTTWLPHVGKLLSEISAQRGTHAIETMLDIAIDTGCMAEFRTCAPVGADIEQTASLLKHARTLPGTSDGGAHSRFYCGGHWPTELIIRFARDHQFVTLEDLHQRLAAKPARVAGLSDRGTLEVGKAADLIVYDLERLWVKRESYEYRHDMPGGDWRRYLPSRGYRHVLVNGVETVRDDAFTGAHPGEVLAPRHATTAA